MSTPEELGREFTKPGKFNFIDRLRGRNLPEDVVDFYLDEATGYRLKEVEDALNNEKNNERATALGALLVELKEILKPQTYKIHLRGLTNEKYDAVAKEVEAQQPAKFEEITNPFTGQKVREQLEDEDRENLFSNLLWAACIVKVVDPEGNEDDDITPEFVAHLRAVGPLDGLRKIDQKILKLRMATEWMDSVQDEDFFPKP